MSEFEPTLRELLAAGHTARFRASGDSMYPAIRNGDYLHVVPCQTSELRRGDVILAATERGLTAHRIVSISEHDGTLRVITRGDNALRSDLPVPVGDVLGRVEKVEQGTNIRQSPPESATITRFVAVLVRRVRSRFQR